VPGEEGVAEPLHERANGLGFDLEHVAREREDAFVLGHGLGLV